MVKSLVLFLATQKLALAKLYLPDYEVVLTVCIKKALKRKEVKNKNVSYGDLFKLCRRF